MTADRITPSELDRIRERHPHITQDTLGDGKCPDCLPGSMCGACADDERFHIERDNRLSNTQGERA